METKITVRPFTPHDLDTIAHLDAIGFGLDEAEVRAHRQADLRGSNKSLVLAEIGGEAVGCANGFPTQMWLSGVPLPLGAVAGVTTHPDYRGRGVCTAMMDYLLNRMYHDGLALSALFPADHRIYHRYGYASVATWHYYTLKPEYLYTFPEGDYVRPFQLADLPAIRSIYRGGQLSLADGRLTRSATDWEKRHLSQANRAAPNAVAVYDHGGVEGYLRYSIDDDLVLRVAEIVVAGEAAWRGLWSYLAQLPHIAAIDYLAPADEPVYRLCRLPVNPPLRRFGFSFTPLYQAVSGFMARIVNLPEALTARFYPHNMMGNRVLKIHDPQLPANEALLKFRIVDGRPEVKPVEGETPQIETDIATFSQIFCGYLSPAEANRLGQLQADEETVDWLGRAMEAKPLFIQRGDWF